MRARGKARPRGTCYLCGKLVWGQPARDAEGIRHRDCEPGGVWRRYRVARKGER